MLRKRRDPDLGDAHLPARRWSTAMQEAVRPAIHMLIALLQLASPVYAYQTSNRSLDRVISEAEWEAVEGNFAKGNYKRALQLLVRASRDFHGDEAHLAIQNAIADVQYHWAQRHFNNVA